MGALGIPELVALVVILAVPVAIAVAGVAFTVRIARHGAPATFARARRRREIP
ncbi:hypothetical protein NI17_004265 [Thermobifida halotolerans]|uniref:Uncharacterized protein n=1 Tax=Thermobifida halotolerans TaxID=483545 RepID=A0AA97LYB0_9ACTN|nr:hypothetical protein [Thermobifida halotolerans]UOE20452.1 hypothetical protein NI17_004265 [Thermobifida halotolerans]